MSLVGTRPPTVDEWDKYELHHRARLATKPGLTGMWQVSGRSNITDFPDCDEIYKQSLTDALIKFAKVIVREGYILTFGAHPTFQELFFDIAKQVDSEKASNRLSMFISNWFLNNNSEQEEYYRQNCNLLNF